MSTTISVVCYKSKVLKNNESPLMLRICKEGKRKYESIGISIDPKYWDSKANKPTSKCPNKESGTTTCIREKYLLRTNRAILWMRNLDGNWRIDKYSGNTSCLFQIQKYDNKERGSFKKMIFCLARGYNLNCVSKVNILFLADTV